MNRLYNLESYLEFITYQSLFKDNIGDSNDKNQLDNLLETYKDFIQKLTREGKDDYVLVSVFPDDQEETLQIHKVIPINRIGESLNECGVYVVPDDIDLLQLSNLFNYSDAVTYIYKSAYYYWCFYSEIQSKKDGRPIILINLDAGVITKMVPIKLEFHKESKRLIPVLEQQNKLDFRLELVQIHNEIYREISAQILKDNFPSCAREEYTINSLCSYLKKISFSNLLSQYANQSNFEIIVELSKFNHNKKTEKYYKVVNINVRKIAEILISKFPANKIQQLISSYQQFQFFIISKYNFLPEFSQLFFGGEITLSNYTSFNLVLEGKKIEAFPLFGITLDKICFEIADRDLQNKKVRKWIELNTENDISYEGNSISIVGRVPPDIETIFSIPKNQKIVELPIQINGKIYPKVFQIVIQESQRVKDTLVKIIFNLVPGKLPDLKVVDIDKKHSIITRLVTPTTFTLNKYSYIDYSLIIETRVNESNQRFNRLRLDLSSFASHICKINNFLQETTGLSDRIDAEYLLNTFRAVNHLLQNNQNDFLQYINPQIHTNEKIKSLIDIIKSLSYTKLFRYIERYSLKVRRPQPDKLELLKYFFIVTGKLYYFSRYLNFNMAELFSLTDLFLNKRTYTNIFDVYLHCLARISTNGELQKIYFDLFSKYFDSSVRKINSLYLWGYGRILRWYFDFSSPSSTNILKYKDHTKHILLRCQDQEDYSFLQNAFLSLIYILCFRQLDDEFCSPGTQEFDLAKQVIDKFKSKRIVLRQVDNRKSLNEIYQEVIEGNLSRDDIDKLLQAN